MVETSLVGSSLEDPLGRGRAGKREVYCKSHFYIFVVNGLGMPLADLADRPGIFMSTKQFGVAKES